MRALALLGLLIPTLAHADGDVSFEVADHGDSVEVIAHNVEARSTNISSIRSRLEIPLAGNPIAGRQKMSDTTVLQVELDGVSARVLSIKTRLDRPEVHALAPLASAVQIGSDLHVTFPRHASLAVPATAAIAPKADAPKPDAPKADAPKPDAQKPELKIEAPKAAVAAAATPNAKIEPALEAPKAIETPRPIAAAPPKTPLAPATSDNSNVVIYGAGGLLALLGGIWMLRNRKKTVGSLSTIDVVAQRALGNKSKIMWLAAGDRELLVSVTNQQVRMLGQWPRTQTMDARMPRLPTARISRMDLDDAETTPAPRFSAAALDLAPTIPASSPVAGLLKLRQSQPVVGRAQTMPSIGRARTMQPLSMPVVNEDVATDDADADLVWAKEILAATGGRR